MRVVLDQMAPDDPDPVEPGSQGTVVDADQTQVIVDWDEDVHRSLHLIPGVDRYHILDSTSEDELEVSFRNLAAIQDKIRSRDGGERGKESSHCPRCGQLFDVHRGAVSRAIDYCNIAVCSTCGTQEAIEQFVLNGAAYGADVSVFVPEGKNGTGFPTETEDNVSNNCVSHSSTSADDIDKNNNIPNSANKLRSSEDGSAEEGEQKHKNKLKITYLPLSDWYIVRVWTGRAVETGEPEEAEDVEDVEEVAE